MMNKSIRKKDEKEHKGENLEGKNQKRRQTAVFVLCGKHPRINFHIFQSRSHFKFRLAWRTVKNKILSRAKIRTSENQWGNNKSTVTYKSRVIIEIWISRQGEGRGLFKFNIEICCSFSTFGVNSQIAQGQRSSYSGLTTSPFQGCCLHTIEGKVTKEKDHLCTQWENHCARNVKNDNSAERKNFWFALENVVLFDAQVLANGSISGSISR